MFKVIIGEEGLKYSHQEPFPKEVKCVHCNGKAQIGFVAFEDSNNDWGVCDLPQQIDHAGLWLHDCCAVAVYFCRKCLETTSLYNQA